MQIMPSSPDTFITFYSNFLYGTPTSALMNCLIICDKKRTAYNILYLNREYNKNCR